MLEKVSLVGRQHIEFRVALLRTSSIRSPPSKRWASIATAQLQPQTHSSRPSDQFSSHLHSPRQFRTGPCSPPTSNLVEPAVLGDVDTLFKGPVNDAQLISKLSASPLRRYFTDPELARQLAEVEATVSPSRSYRILVLAHHLGCALKQNAYECVCYRLSLSREWTYILSIVKLGEEQSGRTTTRLLNWKAKALMETHHYTLLGEILREFSNAQLRPTRRTYQILLAGHLRNRDLAKARDCMLEMEKSGFPVDPSIHGIIVKYYQHLGADHQVQQRALDALSSVSPGTAVAILNGLTQIRLHAEDWTGVCQLLSFFDRQFVALMLPFFNTDMSPPTPTYPSLPPSPFGFMPTAATFNIFLKLMASQGNLNAVQRIYFGMLSMGIKPTSSSVSAMMQAYLLNSQEGIAIAMFKELCSLERGPATVFQDFKTEPISEQLRTSIKGISPTISMLNQLLNHTLRSRGIQEAAPIFNAMKAHNLHPNSTTLQILLAYLSRVERATPQIMLQTLRKLSSPVLHSTPRHLYIIFNRLLRHQKYLTWGAGWETLATQASHHALFQPSIPLDKISVTSPGIDVIAGLKPPHTSTFRPLLTPLLRSLTSRGVQPDGAMLALRMRHEAVTRADVDAAKAVFDTLLSRGIHPNRYHYSALMEGYTRAGNLRAAVDVMKAAESAGIQLNVVMFTILITGYAHKGNPDAALRTFQEMVRGGIYPDVPAIDAVASAFFAVGAYGMARRVLITLWTYIQPFPKELRGAPLKELARVFRELHPSNHPTSSLSKERRRNLRWHLRDLTTLWKKASRRSSFR
ncbi:hypothetical protein AX16_009607 [Volvariella volvacea WC 439]|nr:hypothetical protein AX16_009607 [Volvariella volvacea WC 439]